MLITIQDYRICNIRYCLLYTSANGINNKMLPLKIPLIFTFIFGIYGTAQEQVIFKFNVSFVLKYARNAFNFTAMNSHSLSCLKWICILFTFNSQISKTQRNFLKFISSYINADTLSNSKKVYIIYLKMFFVYILFMNNSFV